MTIERRKTRLTLPQEVVDTFEKLGDNLLLRNVYSAALRRLGWTLQSISDVTGVTRERVRQINEKVTDEQIGRLREFPLPLPPAKPVRVKREIVEPDPAKVARLLELQPLAQQNRRSTEEFRQAAEDYTALVWEVHDADGVSLYRLAQHLGVTHGALRFRLARYGYKLSDTGVSKVYTRIDPTSRVTPK